MAIAIGLEAKTASTKRIVEEIIGQSQDRVDTLRIVSKRLQDLRERLIGGVVCNEESDAPEPVRNETEIVSHNLSTMQTILAEIQSDLSALEQL